MANSLTQEGQYVALGKTSSGTGANKATGNVAGIILAGDELALFSSATTPAKDHTGFTLITGNGGDPKVVGESNWTASLSGSAPNQNVQVVLADQTWTATATISNIAGAYLQDTTTTPDRPLAWWERSSAVSLLTSDQLTADDLTIRLT
jgi:hypothetical protein